MRRVGIGYRAELDTWIRSRPREISCLEIIADHFFDDATTPRLKTLGANYPLLVHGISLSLGTPGSLDPDAVENFARVCAQARPEFISEHVAFTRSRARDLGHLNPIRTTIETLDLMIDHVTEVMARCQTPFLVENITSHLRLPGTLNEPEFLNRLCAATGCGILLDVTNLLVNSRNHGYCPSTWLRQLDPAYIKQFHVVGYSVCQGRFEDLHAEAIQEELWSLIHEALDYAHALDTVIIERDRDFPPTHELATELAAVVAAVA